MAQSIAIPGSIRYCLSNGTEKDQMDLLTSSNELKALCQRWIRDDDYITVDTEFVRTKTFYAQLCVIQVGCSKGAVAIDALAQKLDLTPFYEVLKSSKVIKVIHAGRQDLEIRLDPGFLVTDFADILFQLLVLLKQLSDPLPTSS